MISASTAIRSSVFDRPAVRQLAKFCIVGFSSTILDFSTFNITVYTLGLAPLYGLIAGFTVGVSNGFFWNRRWTFKDRQGDVAKQGSLFVATNVVGLVLNVVITTLALIVAAKCTSPRRK